MVIEMDTMNTFPVLGFVVNFQHSSGNVLFSDAG